MNTFLRSAARYSRLLNKSAEEASGGSSGSDHVMDDGEEKLALLKEAILSLKPKYQTVVSLRFFENLSHAEIADIIGKNESTVRSQLARALKKLRKRLAGELKNVAKEGNRNDRG